jgi:hypothetical protein
MRFAVVLGEVCHAVAFGEVLAQQAAGVLAGAALPRVVRCRGEEPGGEPLLERGVAVELGPVVDRDGPDRPGLALDQLVEPPVDGVLSAAPRSVQAAAAWTVGLARKPATAS